MLGCHRGVSSREMGVWNVFGACVLGCHSEASSREIGVWSVCVRGDRK